MMLGSDAQTPSQANQAADELAIKIRELETEKAVLEEQIRLKDEEIEKRMETEVKLQKELGDRSHALLQLQQKQEQLRGVILSSAGIQEITDLEVIQAFSDLRQKVQQLASSLVSDYAANSPVFIGKAQGMMHFRAVSRPPQTKDVVNRWKQQIFNTLHSSVFCKLLFGLNGHRDQGKKTEEPLEYIDNSLVRFHELVLSKSRGSYTLRQKALETDAKRSE